MVSHCPLEEKVFSIREQPIDFACWLGSLAQSVERQRIKLRVVGSSPTGVHFFFLFLSITRDAPSYTNQAGLGLVALDFINHFVD